MMDWTPLDEALRGTGVDPQAYADEHNTIVVCDEDAAQAGGQCWFGTPAAPGVGKVTARADYEGSGGTCSQIWAPKRALPPSRDRQRDTRARHAAAGRRRIDCSISAEAAAQLDLIRDQHGMTLSQAVEYLITR